MQCDKCGLTGGHLCEPRAKRAILFFEKILKHTKGRYAGQPFLLTTWQRDEIITPLFGSVKWDKETEEYIRTFSMAWIELARKNGKALDATTPILASRGWVAMGDIVPGDTVYAGDGTPTRVSWVGRRHVRPSYRVVSASGKELVAADDHKWTVLDQSKRGRETVVTTAEMLENFTFSSRADRRWALGKSNPTQTPEVSLPLDPYILGAWLGDGSSTKAEITGADQEVFDAVARAGYTETYVYPRGRATTRGYVGGLLAALTGLGVRGNKHIPAAYLTAGTGQRMALLRGLMDTDGCATENARNGSVRVEFCNKNRVLADGVLELARSLGYKATLIEGRATLAGVDCGPKYRVCWFADRSWSPFSLERKTVVLPEVSDDRRSDKDTIVAIEPVGDREVVCISVDHPSHTFLAGRSYMQTHNSEILAGIALYMLMADGEESAEVYSAALDRDQAGLVFDVARRMAQMSPVLQKRLTIIDSKRRIIDPETNSVYAVLPGDSAGALGTNPSAVLFDEVLTQRDRHLWDALRQGFGTRKQPLLVAATTASYTSAAFCLEEHNYSQRVWEGRQNGQEVDPSRFVFMRNTPRDWDWELEGAPATETTPATGWYWSNPALGDFLNLGTLRAEAQEAKEKPSAQNAFRVFRLNQWVSQAQRWLDMALWDENIGYKVDDREYAYRAAWGGLDLASVSDFTSWCLVFPKQIGDDGIPIGYDVRWRFWLPRAAMQKRAPMQEALRVWEEQGWLTVTEGETVDLDKVEADVLSDFEKFNVRMVGYDPWNASHIVQHIEQSGKTAVKVQQSTQRLNAPCREIERVMALRGLNHGGNPIARWNADNVELHIDPVGNIRPDRSKSGDKIDGIAALCNALFVALMPQEEEPPVCEFLSLEDYLREG